MDDFKKIAGKYGQLCPVWYCWENDTRRNWIRKHARKAARTRLRVRDKKEWNLEP